MEVRTKRTGYRDDIDGMRALAVLGVIVNHFHHAALPGGYLGVDVFFVISGFVITNSLERTDFPHLGEQLASFYSRRIKRLMPALLVMVVLSSAVIRLFDPDPLASTLTGIMSLFGLSNLFLFSQATNYFGHSAERNIFSHTWSLGVEEQFYLLYPFLFRLHRIKRGPVHGARLSRLVLGVLSLVSLGAFIYFYRASQPAAYFLMPCRFFELGAGCLLASLSKGLRVGGMLAKFPPFAALVLMVLALVLAGSFPVSCTVVMVGATVLLLGSSRPGTATFATLSQPVPVYLGRISYSLYLWHWPVLCLSRWTVGVHWFTLPFQIAVIFALSAGSYHLIERPLREGQWASGHRGTLLLGVSAMMLAAAVVYMGQRRNLPKFTGNLTAEATLDSPEPGYVAEYSHRHIDNCFAEAIYGNDGARPDGPQVEEALRYCTADNGSRLRLFFVGDSHGMDMFPLADKLYHDGVATVTDVFEPGCKVPPTTDEGTRCYFADRLMKEFAKDHTHDNVLVVRNNISPRKLNGDLRDFAQRLEALLDQASAANFQVIYVAPAPKFYGVGPDSLCAKQWYRPEWALDVDCRTGYLENHMEELARRHDMMEYLQQLSARRSELLVFDPFDPLCGSASGDCTPMRNGKLIYRDNTHITAEGSYLLAAPFETFLASHGLTETEKSRPAGMASR